MTEAAQPDHDASRHLTVRRFTAFDHHHPALGGLLYAFGAAIAGVMVAAACQRLRLPHSGLIGRAFAALGWLLVSWDRVVGHGVIKRRIAYAQGGPPYA